MDRREYLKHFMIILGGNGAAQAANLLSYPLLARLYAPEQFGQFALFVAAAAIPGSIACARFDLAIPTAPRGGRYGVFWLCMLISAAAGTVSTAGAAIYWSVYSPPGNIIVMSLLLGLSVFLVGASSALMYYLMRHNRFRASSSSLVVRTGGAVLCQLALALAAPTGQSLIFGFVFGQSAQVLYLLAVYWRTSGLPRFRMRDVRAMFTRFRRQVAVDIPSTLLSALSLNMLTFVLGSLYSPQIVGFYSLGNRLAAVPLQLVNDSLSQTFFQKAARAYEDKGHFWDEMKFGLLTSGALSGVAFLGLIFLSYPFITTFLGQRWAPSADMLVLLAPMMTLASLTQSVTTAVFVLRKTHWRFIHIALAIVLHLIAFGAAYHFHLEWRTYLILASLLIAVEWAIYLAFLVVAVRQMNVRVSRAALEAIEQREIDRLLEQQL